MRNFVNRANMEDHLAIRESAEKIKAQRGKA